MQKFKKILSPITYHLSPRLGFTLIELLVVISIIGILASLTLVSYSGAQRQVRDTQRKSDLGQMKAPLEAYFSTYGVYPSTGGGWWGECSNYGSHPRSGANGYIPNLAPAFIEELPRDPRHGQLYPPCNNGGSTCYLYNSNGADYKLLAHCSPESYPSSPESYPTNHPFYDPSRPTWAWQIHSSDVSKGW